MKKKLKKQQIQLDHDREQVSHDPKNVAREQEALKQLNDQL